MDYLNNLRAVIAQETIDHLTLDTDICWFCDKPGATSENAETIYFNRNHQMTFKLSGRHQNQWEEQHRKIPRCKNCRETHLTAGNAAARHGWLTALGCLFIGALLPLVTIYLIFGTFTFSAKTTELLKVLGFYGVERSSWQLLVWQLSATGRQSKKCLRQHLKRNLSIWRKPTRRLCRCYKTAGKSEKSISVNNKSGATNKSRFEIRHPAFCNLILLSRISQTCRVNKRRQFLSSTQTFI